MSISHIELAFKMYIWKLIFFCVPHQSVLVKLVAHSKINAYCNISFLAWKLDVNLIDWWCHPVPSNMLSTFETHFDALCHSCSFSLFYKFPSWHSTVKKNWLLHFVPQPVKLKVQPHPHHTWLVQLCIFPGQRSIEINTKLLHHRKWGTWFSCHAAIMEVNKMQMFFCARVTEPLLRYCPWTTTPYTV